MNRRPLTIYLAATTLLLAAAACSKREPAAKPAATPAKSQSEATKPVVAPVPAVPAKENPAPKPKTPPMPKPSPAPEPEAPPVPEVLFSLRGLEGGRLANDRPLFVSVRIESSVDREAALTLAPAGGRWSDGLKVELVAAGAPDKVLLQAQRIDGADESAAATLGTGRAAEGTWLFPSAEITRLAPGDYAVRVTLAIPDGNGWHGTVAGEPAAFKLGAPAAAVTPEQQAQRAVALAGEAMLAKDWPKAAQLLDERLAVDPDNIDLLKTRAVLCLEGNDPLAANVCVNRAWARVMREKWTHPPADLYVLSQAAMAALAQPPADTKTPLPKWTMPPAAVLAPLESAGPAPKAN